MIDDFNKGLLIFKEVKECRVEKRENELKLLPINEKNVSEKIAIKRKTDNISGCIMMYNKVK